MLSMLISFVMSKDVVYVFFSNLRQAHDPQDGKGLVERQSKPKDSKDSGVDSGTKPAQRELRT